MHGKKDYFLHTGCVHVLPFPVCWEGFLGFVVVVLVVFFNWNDLFTRSRGASIQSCLGNQKVQGVEGERNQRWS